MFFFGGETLNPPTQHPATLPQVLRCLGGRSLGDRPGSHGELMVGYGGWKPETKCSHPLYFLAVELDEKFWSTLPPTKTEILQLHRWTSWIVEWRLAGKKEVCILGCFSLATQRDPLRDPSFWWLGFTNFLFWRIDFSFDSNALGHYPNAIMHHVVETEERKTCAFLGKHRGACAFHPAHFVDQSQASFSSHGFLTKTVHQVKIECYWMLYIIYSCFLRLQVSLVTIIMIIMFFIYRDPPKKNKQSPKGACFCNTSQYNIPEANPANPLPVSVLQRYPLEDHKDCRQRFWSTWPVDLGFWNMFFLRLHRVDRLVGDFHCPRDYIELMRLLSRKCKYRIHVHYEHMHLAQKNSYLRMQVWDRFVFEWIFSMCSSVAKAMSGRSSWEVLGGVLRSQIWLDLKRASLSMW